LCRPPSVLWQSPGMVITEADMLFVIGRALDGMAGIVTDLGDELANARPDLPGANSPYGIVTHCLGVIDYWVGWCVAGRLVERDRDAEFQAVGPVGSLVDRVERAKSQVARDIAGVDMTGPATVDQVHPLLGSIRTRGAAVLHAYEELAQHRGQLEITRDVLVAGLAGTSDA
jgi:hypothetical protein